MLSEKLKIVEKMFKDPLSILTLDTPQSSNNMVVIPLIYKENIIDFISVREAEDLGLIKINESETVSQLQVVNKSDKPVLIPFGVTVRGGKQDRTIWEPILLPAGGKHDIFKRNSGDTQKSYTIPAKCVEQSRWHYKKGKGFKSTKTRIHPNVAFEAISSSGQGGVWGEIQAYRTEMNYASNIAPTQSYLEMTENIEKEVNKFSTSFRNVKNQCGIAVFINNEFIGMELYANPRAWQFMGEDVLKAFSIEALRTKGKSSVEKAAYYELEIKKVLRKLNLEFSVRNGIGLGQVVEFKSENKKWRGNTLVHEDALVQFYLVSKRGGFKEEASREYMFQTNVQQRIY